MGCDIIFSGKQAHHGHEHDGYGAYLGDHLEIPNFSQSNLKILRFVDKPEFSDASCGGWQGAVQDSRSLKPRFKNANLLINHVLDSCVKLLAVLHISRAQGRSMDLSVEIAAG